MTTTNFKKLVPKVAFKMLDKSDKFITVENGTPLMKIDTICGRHMGEGVNSYFNCVSLATGEAHSIDDNQQVMPVGIDVYMFQGV